MRFGPVRPHISFVFENFIRDFGLLIIAVLFALLTGGFSDISENIVIAVVTLIGPLLRLKAYFFTSLAVENDMILIREGLVSKSVTEVPVSSIITVNMTQTIFHRIFGA